MQKKEERVKKWSWKQSLILLIGIFAISAIGCEPLMDEFWPCMVGKDSHGYLTEDPNATRGVVPLAEAREMRTDILVKHRDYLLEMKRNIEDDDNAFRDAMRIDARIAESEQWKDYMVGDKSNPLSLATLLAGTSFAGLVGYKVKRKGDTSPDEVKVIVAKAVEEERNGTKQKT